MLITILSTILVLGVLIFVHELGHFLVAKAVDIEVSRFSIGFGPKLVGFQRGETEYMLSAIPLGGYVKMEGMADEEAYAALEGGASDEAPRGPSPRDFDAKPLWARTLVIIAGVFMNLVFAVVVFTLFARTQGTIVPTVAEVTPDTPAEVAGLLTGDEIVRVAEDTVRQRLDVIMAIQGSADRALPIRVLRDGRSVDLVVTPRIVTVLDEDTQDSVDVVRIGVVMGGPASKRPISWAGAVGEGFRQTGFWAGSIWGALSQFASGEASIRDFGGPIMIGQLSGEFARSGFWQLLRFMAILSVNLAVINLLPIPVLDGGHLMFIAFEGIRGRAMTLEGRLRLTQVGFLIVVGLMVMAFAADIMRLLGA